MCRIGGTIGSKSCARHIYRDGKMKKCNITLLGICLMLTACNMGGGGKQTGSTHYPFKESKKDRWGLVDANGKVLVENEFKEEPSPVINGMFFAKRNGEFELYSVDNPTKTVGETYKAIAYFADGLAPCVKANEGIKYIDKNGDVKFELPLEYIYAKKFDNGYSLIGRKAGEHSAEEDYGEDSSWLEWDAVNTKGEITRIENASIESVFSNGYFLVSEKKSGYEKEYFILNLNGSDKTQLKDYSPNYLYDVFDDFISPDLKYYVFYDDEERKYGVRSMAGETIIKPKHEELHFLKNGKMKFRDNDDYNEEWGVMDIKGNVLMKPRYSVILLHDNDKYLVGKDDKMALVNSKEDRLMGYEHEVLYGLTDKVFIAYDEGHKYEIITLDGKSIASFSEFTLVNNNYNTVKSDYFDAEACIKSLFNLSGSPLETLYGFYGMTPGDCANKMGINLSKDDIEGDNNWFPYQFLELTEYGRISYSLGFEKVVETYYDDDDYWELRPHYTYSNSLCDAIRAKLQLNYDAQSHTEQISKQLEEVILGLGYSKSGISSDGYQMYQKPGCQIEKIKINSDELFVKVYHR